MMVRLGVLACLIASGVMAPAALASGPFWHVNGKKLASGETKQLKLQNKGPITLKLPGTLEIVCQRSISEGATIEGSTVTQGQDKGRTIYSSCAVPVPTGEKCKVVGDQIKTNQTKSYLAEAETQTKIVDVFEPTQGSTFSVFRLENGPGGTCPFKELGVAGSAVAEMIPSGVEGQEGLMVFPSTAILKVKHEGTAVTLPSLKTVGVVSTFSAVYGVRLATFPEKFGVFET